MVQSCDFHAPTASVMKEYCIEVLFKRTKVSFANIGSFVHTYSVLHGTKHAVSHSYNMFCFVLHVLTIGID